MSAIVTFKIRRSESVRTSEVETTKDTSPAEAKKIKINCFAHRPVEFLDVFVGVHLGAVGGLVEEEVPNDAAVVDVVLTVH